MYKIRETLTSVKISFDVNDVIGLLQPPKRFSHSNFSNFVPDPLYPSQRIAKEKAVLFAASLRNGDHAPSRVHRWIESFQNANHNNPPIGGGLYIDGGFGVGKTHLLRAIWNEVAPPKAFSSFVELVNVVGAIGFETACDQLSRISFLAIDEFELDDPGETVLIAALLECISSRGVHLAVTSNTLPAMLGDGRFPTEDFMRDIQGLSARFDLIVLDGPDFRRPTKHVAKVTPDQKVVVGAISEHAGRISYDEIGLLCEHLVAIHPVMYPKLIQGLDAIVVRFSEPFRDLADALRFAVLVDRAYDHEIPLLAIGIDSTEIYPQAWTQAGFRAKFGRSLSRLSHMREEALALMHLSD